MAASDRHEHDAPRETIAPRHGDRLIALDHLRGFIVGLVVLHHAILAYCTFGHIDRTNYALSTAPVVDRQSWVGFDVLVRLDDAFFMPLLFLLSGLFVWDGLARRGAGAFVRARMQRLGLPFVVAVTTIVPLAYYPSFIQAGGRSDFGAFWIRTVTQGPWPSGPPWFIGSLLVFDAAAAMVFGLVSRRDGADRPPPVAPSPIGGFGSLLAGSCLLFLPLLLIVGPARWFGLGPLAIQGSRIGLYAVYFAAGVALGRRGRPAVASFGRAVSARWATWVLVAALTGAIVLAAGTAVTWNPPRPAALALLGLAQAIHCAAAGFTVLAFFLRFGGNRSPAWTSLAANGFAIYLLHYPFVTWAQFGLLGVQIDAVAKASTTFTAALVGSWALAALLRRVPVVRRIL